METLSLATQKQKHRSINPKTYDKPYKPTVKEQTQLPKKPA
jgi:hypothetical protein